MKTTIAVLAYNHQQMTSECQGAIEDAVEHWTKPELLLIDNGSKEPLETRAGWRTVRYEINRGNVAGQNQCFHEAAGDWVVFVSNDVIVDRYRFWDEMMKPRLGQVMPMVWSASDRLQSGGGLLGYLGNGKNIQRMDELGRPLDYIPSICYGMLKSTWDDAGRFDASYPGAYEDVDMGLKLGSGNLVLEDDAFVWHKGNATLQYRTNAAFRAGRKRLIEKHFTGIRKKLALLTV